MSSHSRLSRRHLLAGAAGTLALATSGRAVAQSIKPGRRFIPSGGNAGNATMLPEVAESVSANFTGDQFADHIGKQPASTAPDPGLPAAPPSALAR